MSVEPTTLEQGRQGLKVTAVNPRSPAARAGLKPDDVLLEINRRPVKALEDVKPALEARIDKRYNLIRFLRAGHEKLTSMEPATIK